MDARIWRCHWWIGQVDGQYLRTVIQPMVVDAGFTIVNAADHQFKPYGYACVLLLAESHVAIHTWPEHYKTYVDLASCNEEIFNEFVERFWRRFHNAILEHGG